MTGTAAQFAVILQLWLWWTPFLSEVNAIIEENAEIIDAFEIYFSILNRNNIENAKWNLCNTVVKLKTTQYCF